MNPEIIKGILVEQEEYSRVHHRTPDLQAILDELSVQIALMTQLDQRIDIIQAYSEHPSYDPIRHLIRTKIVECMGIGFGPKIMSEAWTAAIVRKAVEDSSKEDSE